MLCDRSVSSHSALGHPRGRDNPVGIGSLQASLSTAAPLGLRVSGQAVPMILQPCSGPCHNKAAPDKAFPSPCQAWIGGIRAGSITSCGNHVKASCRWIAFNAEAAGEAPGTPAWLRERAGFIPVLPGGLGGGSIPQRHQGEWRGFSLRSPKSADSPTALGLHCKPGCPSGVPGWGDSWEHPVGDGQAGGWL